MLAHLTIHTKSTNLLYENSIVGKLICRCNHNCTFHALFEKLTAVFIYAVYMTCCMICVCGTTARAIHFCPAILTFGLCIGVASAKFVLCGGVFDAVPDVAEAVFGVANELMAGEKLTPRGNCHIFRTRTAACDAFIDARTVFEV